MEDGRYNKVASVVGNTLKYHPHGDIGVFETLVGLGQKGLLIDMQGNWGNTLTGDGPAAQRYIEARLTAFAKEVVFNPKVTDWKKSYDGRNDEPISLPVKFPLLLAQGTEGIAVSLACKILPHNFTELCDAAVAILKEEDFELLPDFPQGGDMDASNYHDGMIGGKVKVRAKIVPHGKNDLEIVELVYGTTATSLRDSILEAEGKGKIKIKKVHDMTGEQVSLIVELPPGTNQETAKQALYAFTECEMTHHPMGVVIKNAKPEFLSVCEILVENVERTMDLIRRELELRLKELDERWMKLNLEKLFVRTKSYQALEEAKSVEEGIERIKKALTPHLGTLRREPTEEDYRALTEMKIRRISLYDEENNSREIQGVEKEEKETGRKLKRLKETTIEHFEEIKRKYGTEKERRTKIIRDGFSKIQAVDVAVSNQKVYWNPEGGFVGTGLKKDQLLPFEINELTDIAGIDKNAVLKILRPGEKSFYGEGLLDARPTGKDKNAPVYNMLYEDVESGTTYAKRFQINGGFIREKAYPLGGGNEKQGAVPIRSRETRRKTTKGNNDPGRERWGQKKRNRIRFRNTSNQES